LIVWQEFFAGTAGFDDHAYGLATDSEGNIVMAGTTTTFNEDYDIRLAKYDPSGTQLWAVTVDGGLLLDDFAFDVAVDADDNVLVTGSTYVTNNGFDAWIAKYNFNGLLVWEQTHNGPIASKDQGHSIVVDADGNAIVGGYEFVLGQGRNAWLAKYDPDGTQLWTVSHDGISNGTDEVGSVEIDVDGNIVAAGQTHVDGEDSNIWVGKYDPDGAEIWVAVHDGPMGGEDFASGIGALPDGSMIVTGATEVAFNVLVNPIYDVWLGRFDTDGNLVWEQNLDGPLMGDDFGEEIAVDSLGNYVVVGALAVDETVPDTVYNGQPPQRHGWIRKFDPDDNEVWTVEFGPKTRDTWGYGVAVDAGDNVFAAGQLRQQGMTNIDTVLLKIAP
jgi:uncharacterized delta-60 repeat protein